MKPGPLTHAEVRARMAPTRRYGRDLDRQRGHSPGACWPRARIRYAADVMRGSRIERE